MGSKSETIARHFESKIREAVGTLQALDDADSRLGDDPHSPPEHHEQSQNDN